MKKKALGRGLQSLIPELPLATQVAEKRTDVLWLNPADIRPNQHQPRERFNAERMEELASSIRSNGVIQPILVRRQDHGYELIAGERRLRAVQQLGYTEIPALIREDVGEHDALELSLLENIQRENLNPVEEATAYQRLMTEFELTQEAIAAAVGKDRSTVANAIRLLKLPTAMLAALRDGAMTMGHARALLSITNAAQQQRVFEELLAGRTTVRQAEARVARARARTAVARDPNVAAVEDELARALGTRVRIAHRRRRGRIVIEYYSLDDLDRIRHIIIGE